jgi:hypothetical protein
MTNVEKASMFEYKLLTTGAVTSSIMTLSIMSYNTLLMPQQGILAEGRGLVQLTSLC